MSSQISPPITVLMTVYNGMPYLHEAVESIFRQTFQDWQFVIVNDGSTDGSGAYLEGLDDPRVKLIHQENQGLAAALNRGIEHCHSEYVARLDCDDVAMPDRLAKQYEFLSKRPQVGLVGTQFERLGTARSGFPSKLPCDHATIMDALLDAKHAMCHSTIMCRTELLKQVGGYWPDYISEDWDLYLKIGERAKLANLEDVLLHVRVHNASLNGQRLAEIRHFQRYAADCSRRRQQNMEPVDIAEYNLIEEQRPWSWRLNEKFNERAVQCYRAALVNILGGHPLRGYALLGISAFCSPTLTKQRIQRMTRFGRRQSSRTDHRFSVTTSSSRST
jgi:glycosyltransferase involved in cell wall biosynthesis